MQLTPFSEFEMPVEVVSRWIQNLQWAGKLPPNFLSWRFICGTILFELMRKVENRAVQLDPLGLVEMMQYPRIAPSTKARIFAPDPSFVQIKTLQELFQQAASDMNKTGEVTKELLSQALTHSRPWSIPEKT